MRNTKSYFGPNFGKLNTSPNRFLYALFDDYEGVKKCVANGTDCLLVDTTIRNWPFLISFVVKNIKEREERNMIIEYFSIHMSLEAIAEKHSVTINRVKKKITLGMLDIRQILGIYNYYPLNLLGVIIDEGISDIEYEVLPVSSIVGDSDVLKDLDKMVNELPELERKVILELFLQNKTLKEVGKEFNVTKERILQWERKAIKSLRESASTKDLYQSAFKAVKKIKRRKNSVQSRFW